MTSAPLVEEACRRSKLVWLTAPDLPGRAVWHVWHEGAVHVVTGGLEQPLPELPATVEVTVRSKDKGGRLVTWVARVDTLDVGSAEWPAAAAALHAERLNPPDGEAQPQRWARESRILRLTPTGQVRERPGALPTASLAAAPATTPATTRGRLPFVLGRRRR